MFKSIFEDVKREFTYGNMITRIIIVNVGFFIAINILWIIFRLASGWENSGTYEMISQGLMMSSDWKHILTHPWVLFTHMFLHVGFWHILWNMLLLYWFGRIVGDFIGNQRVLPIYLLGGLAGAAIFFLVYNMTGLGGGKEVFALGASAAVMAMVVAAGVLSPDFIMRLLFLGDVKLKYIVGVLVFLDLLGIAGDANTGGHFAHLGGALMGGLFITQLNRGNDLSIPVNRITDSIFGFFNALFSSGNGLRVEKRGKQQHSRSKSWQGKGKHAKDEDHQERVDAILDKIRESGYDSLSDEEKEFLFNASKQ